MAVGGNAHGGSPDGVSADSWPAEAIMWLGIGGAVLVAVAMFVAIKRRQAGGHKGSRSSRGASFAIKVKVEEGKPGTGLQLVSDGVIPSSGFVVGTEPFDADLIVSEPSMHSIQAGTRTRFGGGGKGGGFEASFFFFFFLMADENDKKINF